ncbi:putative ABC-type xenobiotic transporter [Helianthus annuus]|nr:putative ABC-type xenobiotic transporter [Helianthus annuus]
MRSCFVIYIVHCKYFCFQVDVFGSIAYVSQTSWIQSGTIQDNILYGKPMVRDMYEKAIKACALDKDIMAFEHGDLTEIGQRGINMSGGQKQRIQLARAVYNGADIYLLDDPFSAVDAHTATSLFNVRLHLLTMTFCKLLGFLLYIIVLLCFVERRINLTSIVLHTSYSKLLPLPRV